MAFTESKILAFVSAILLKVIWFFNVTLNLNKVKDNPQVVENFKGNQFVRLRISKKDKI